MSLLERNLGIFPTLQPLRPPNAPWMGGRMIGRAIAAAALTICSLLPRGAAVAAPVPGPRPQAPGQGRTTAWLQPRRIPVRWPESRATPWRPDHQQSLDSHAGHGRDLAELVPIQPVKFIHLKQPVFHQAGENEQESCKTEIEATFYFVALNA